MLRDETVRRRHWMQDAEFLDLFGAVSVLPGPSSTQLAIVLARRRAGWVGLLAGGACFILPAMAIVLALAWAYVRYGSTPTGGGVLYEVGSVPPRCRWKAGAWLARRGRAAAGCGLRATRVPRYSAARTARLRAARRRRLNP